MFSLLSLILFIVCWGLLHFHLYKSMIPAGSWDDRCSQLSFLLSRELAIISAISRRIIVVVAGSTLAV